MVIDFFLNSNYPSLTEGVEPVEVAGAIVVGSLVDVNELIKHGVVGDDGANLLEANMAISDELTDQNIVDMVKEGVEVEEAIKSTN